MEELDFIVANAVNPLELLFEAQKAYEDSQSGDMVSEHISTTHSDALGEDDMNAFDMLDDPIALMQMLKKQRGIFTFCCSTVVYEGKKKRYVSLIATGENRSTNNTTSKPMTVFQVISTRNETICRFVISGDIENSEPLSSDEELGKWAIVKNHMYPRLIDSIMRVVGKDFQARSLDLYYSIKKALDTTVLDQLIESAENDRI